MADSDLRQEILNNAYRRLGIGGGATQQQIDASARKMKLWSDPGLIGATPWDLPGLGPLARTRALIDEAQTAMMDPIARVQTRMIWYCRSGPPLEDVSLQSARQPSADDVADAHDAVARLLHQAVCMSRLDAWESAFKQATSLCEQPRYIQWMQEIERDGRFEKRAADAEIVQTIKRFPARLASAMLGSAEGAIEQGRHQQAVSLLYVLRLESQKLLMPQIITPLLDRLEDQILLACAEIKKILHAHAGYDPSALQRMYAGNAEPIYRARDVYDGTIAARLPALRALGGDESDRIGRVRVSCAQVLTLLATRWNWAGNDDQQQQTLAEAAAVARGTAEESEVNRRRHVIKVAAAEVAQADKPPTGTSSAAFRSKPPPRQLEKPRKRSLLPAQVAIITILSTLGVWRLLASLLASATWWMPSSGKQDVSDDFQKNNELYNRYLTQEAERMQQHSSTAPSTTTPAATQPW